MDEHGEPTHISPIFVDLLKRQFLKENIFGITRTSCISNERVPAFS